VFIIDCDRELALFMDLGCDEVQFSTFSPFVCIYFYFGFNCRIFDLNRIKTTPAIMMYFDGKAMTVRRDGFEDDNKCKLV
jgi:hypothetical protein